MRLLNGRAQSVGVWTLLAMARNRYGISSEAAFNLSHSGDYVLCSVDMDENPGTKAGCDIEAVNGQNLKVAKRFFCPSEYTEIMRQETKEKQSDTFCRFWVLKESFMKATRKGMALSMSSFEIELGNPPVLTRKPEEFADSYYYREYNINDIPYKIAVCSTDAHIEGEIQMEFKL